MMKAVILCGGLTDLKAKSIISDGDMIICADGGWNYARDNGIVPDMIIGDCDSSDEAYPSCIPHMVYPAEKDKTDTALCVDYAIENGCENIVLLGATGGRLDHEYANYNLLVYGLEKGVRIRIVDGNNEVWAENKPFYVRKNDKKYISFFAFGGTVRGLTIKGLKYPTSNLELGCNSTLTCGNEFDRDDEAYIEFTDGILLVMCCNDR